VLSSLQSASLSMGCISCLYICLYAQFEILQMTSSLRAKHGKRYLIPYLFFRTPRRDAPPHAATPLGCHPTLRSLPLSSALPTVVVVSEPAARSLRSPCSIFPFPLPLPHGSMAGRPSPIAMRRMHGPHLIFIPFPAF
jgi:hypothetical protein